MTRESADEEYTKFMPEKLQYSIVANNDKEHYQRKQLVSYISDDSEPSSHSNKLGIFHQIVAASAILIISAACGMPIGYSAVVLPQLMEVNETTVATEIAIDIEMGSWIASVHSLATPVGSVISGWLADSIGRRSTLLISVIPTFLGWSLIATAKTYPMLLFGRLVCGFATGILGGPGQVYIAETTEPNIRSLLIGGPIASYSLGILLVYALGSLMHWRMVAWCGNILPLISALAIFFIPESPNWLLRHNKMEKALKALEYLRGNSIVAQKELNEMVERLENERTTTKTNENIFKLCCQRVAIKPLVIVTIFVFLQMFSGTFIVVFYAVDIIAEFGADFDTKSAAIWTAVVRMICTLIFCFVLLFIKRRPLLIWSGIGSGLSCLILSIYLYQYNDEPKTSNDVYVAATCLFAYIAFNTSLMVMPGIMIGELFPARIRGRTAGGIFCCMNIVLFIFSKTFPMIHLTVRMQGVFLIFAISSFLISFFMVLLQPETKDRSLEEIEDYFNENNWLWCNRDKKYRKPKKTELLQTKT